MQVRDILEMEPTMEGTSGLGTSGPQPCTVIWVHPAKRFFVVKFRSAITGETWREAVWFPLKQHSDNFNRLPIIGGRKV